MASRERKRAQRRKRKERGAERQVGQVERREVMAARTEAKNQAAREALEPLEAGERPTIVTIAAVVSTLVTVASVAGYALWDVLRDEPRPHVIQVLTFVAVVGAMSYGLWRGRYWAVLGFHAVLVLVMVVSALGAVSALTVGLAIGNVVLLAVAGTMFYFMIKAMARIQMPERRPPQ